MRYLRGGNAYKRSKAVIWEVYLPAMRWQVVLFAPATWTYMESARSHGTFIIDGH